MLMKHKRQSNYLNLSKSKPKRNGQLKKRITLLKPIDLIQREMNEMKIKNVKNLKSRLSNGEQKAMKHLSKRRDIL